MIKRSICLLLVACCLFQAGCWDRRELSELAIVLAAGVDSAPGDNVRLTLQIVRPRAFSGGVEKQAGAPKENNVWVVSETGRTVLDAQRLLERKLSREIYWGHNIILVFGERAARAGIRETINFFSRSPAARETIWLFLARGEAEKLLDSHSQLENTSAQAAGAMARMAVGAPVMLKDLRMMLASKGTNLVLPRIELTPSGTPQGAGMKENIPGVPKPKEPSEIRHAEITVTGTGVFKDDKLVGWLNISETRGMLWLKGLTEKGVITVPSPTGPDKNISVRLVRGNTEVKPFFDGQNIWFDVKINMAGDLLEQQSTEDLTDPGVFKTIENEVARAIEARARSALEKAQFDYGVDIFDFGEAFHRKYKREWNTIKDRWNEVFTGVDVNIAAEAHIRHTGLATKRVSVPR